MSVAISCALIIAIFILIYSLRSSLEKWINKNIVADIYIKPASCLSNYCFYPLSDEIIDIVKDFDEVAGIDRFRALNIDFNNKKVIAGFADISIKRKYYSKRYFDEKYDNVLREMEGDGQVVSISEYIALKYNLRVGDTINIKTPQGDKGFKIVDISSSYSTTSGFLYFDRKWLRRYWNLDDTTQFSIYVKEGVNVDSFIEKLKRRLLPVYSLEIMDNQELRDKIMVIFNRSFAITYAIETISIIISIIGLVNTLLALVFERKREISIIRYLGGTWRQIEKNFVLTSGTISILGLILGSLIGFLISLIFINVVNKISFGWEIHLKIPYFYISIVMCTLFLVSLMAGILPSRVAKRVDPKSFITFE
jgi:putative ABC transport system permease protein